MTVGLVTRHPQEASELTVTELAVEEHKFNGPNEVPYLINFMETDVHFYEALGRDMAAEVKNWGLCIEKERAVEVGVERKRFQPLGGEAEQGPEASSLAWKIYDHFLCGRADRCDHARLKI